MNVSELRIGNYYQKEHLEGFERWGVVEDVDFFRSSDELEAIKLTPEIMVLFGFENEDDEIDYSEFVKKNVVINSEGSDCQEPFTFKIDSYDASRFISIEIKYVHQLQNLYYALTGEELTLNKIL